VVGISDDTYRILTSDPFDKPLGYWPVAKYFRGKLIGTRKNLAANGNAYPFMRWRPVINTTSTTADGKFNIQFSETITPELGEETTIKPGSFEAWQAE
jgi:hypothetical protein